LQTSDLQEHRVDPALRNALEKLDSARKSEPSMNDFAIEKFLNGKKQSGGLNKTQQYCAHVVSPDTVPTTALYFPTELLLVAAKELATHSSTMSRSTSPGSSITQLSITSSSSGSERARLTPHQEHNAMMPTVLSEVRHPNTKHHRRPAKVRPRGTQKHGIRGPMAPTIVDHLVHPIR